MKGGVVVRDALPRSPWDHWLQPGRHRQRLKAERCRSTALRLGPKHWSWAFGMYSISTRTAMNQTIGRSDARKFD